MEIIFRKDGVGVLTSLTKANIYAARSRMSLSNMTSTKYTSALETTEHVRAKVSALREVPEITVTESIDTVEAHIGSRMIFAALRKYEGGPWITRQMRGMFDRVA